MSKIRAVELELGFAVDLLSSVSKMLAQRSIGPRFASIEPVIGCIVSDKIDRELAPNDQLFEKRFFVLRRRIAIFHRERYREHADLAKMQIRRQLARAVEVRVITPAGVAIKAVAEEAPKCFLRGRVAVSKLRYGAIERSSGIRSSKFAPGATLRIAPRDLTSAMGITSRHQKSWQKRMNLRPNGARCIMFFPEHATGHDEVRVHSQNGICNSAAIRALARSASRNGFSSPITRQG